MASSTRYWVASLPVRTTKQDVWANLQSSITSQAFDTPLYRFSAPDLHVGTLDSLLALSDDLVKSNTFTEGVTQKIRR